MTKKIFGMAAISALAFSMFACSGEDGADGVNGKDGADGISCSVKALKDKSGFKVLCDGDSVGVLKNGTDGKAGKDGAAGKDGKDGEDGEDASATDGKAGKDGSAGKDGTSCTVKSVKDGFTVICGTDTVGTVKNGDAGEDGDDCSLTEGDNGVITVTCGNKSVNIFKALCADRKTPYDPETQLCAPYWDFEAGDIAYAPIQRCKNWSVADPSYDEDEDHSDEVYPPLEFFCDNDVLVPKCPLKDKDGNDSTVTFDYENNWCDLANNKIAKKEPCGTDDDGKKFKKKPSEYCYRNPGDPKTKMRTAPMEECGTGNGLKTYSPVEKFCAHSNGTLRDKDICAENKDKADKYNIGIRFMASEHMQTHEGQLCDSRDWKIYKTKSNETYTWMDENLRYVGENVPTADIDSSSVWVKNNPNNEDKGRLYLWSAVIDSTSLANAATPKLCGYGEPACTFDKPVQGICPDGWHVPSKAEAGDFDLLTAVESSYMEYDVETKAFVYRSTGWMHVWTTDDYSAESAYGAYLSFSAEINKTRALAVRCVKDAPEEVAP